MARWEQIEIEWLVGPVCFTMILRDPRWLLIPQLRLAWCLPHSCWQTANGRSFMAVVSDCEMISIPLHFLSLCRISRGVWMYSDLQADVRCIIVLKRSKVLNLVTDIEIECLLQTWNMLISDMFMVRVKWLAAHLCFAEGDSWSLVFCHV